MGYCTCKEVKSLHFLKRWLNTQIFLAQNNLSFLKNIFFEKFMKCEIVKFKIYTNL